MFFRSTKLCEFVTIGLFFNKSLKIQDGCQTKIHGLGFRIFNDSLLFLIYLQYTPLNVYFEDKTNKQVLIWVHNLITNWSVSRANPGHSPRLFSIWWPGKRAKGSNKIFLNSHMADISRVSFTKKYLYRQSQYPKPWIGQCHIPVRQRLEHSKHVTEGRGFDSYQSCAFFHFIKFWLYQEQLFTVENECMQLPAHGWHFVC